MFSNVVFLKVASCSIIKNSLTSPLHLKCLSLKYLTNSYHSVTKVNVKSSIFELVTASQKWRYAERRNLRIMKKAWFNKSKKPKHYEVVGLGEVSAGLRPMLEHIKKPEYAVTGIVKECSGDIEVKNKEQIKCMRQSCSLARMILDEVGTHVKAGRTTDELDYIVFSMCNSYGAYPSPLNYRGFPKSVCTSVNNIACHGIPDNRPMKEGDIVAIDVSVFFNGYHGDCAASFAVGKIDPKGQLLMDVALKCLEQAVGVCHSGQPFCAIGKVISEFAKMNNFTVVPAFCGHGIGSYFHGAPSIMHTENDDSRLMQEGMVFTIEPVICEGQPDIVVLEDGWTAATADNSRCAQFEHTILIEKDRAEILTKPNSFKVDEK